MTSHLLAVALIGLGGSAAVSTAPQLQADCTFASSYPRQYVAYHVGSDKGIIVDGSLDEPAWTEVGFTDPFVDISTTTLPKFVTKAKMRWTDDFLYVGGYLEEPNVWANISETCHCVNASQNQVIYDDNDFETFVDAEGSTHYYKETEFNQRNLYWDLVLNKPYNDGGGENSSRVFGPAGWDMYPNVRSAVSTDGVINDPGVLATRWTIEIAFPLADLAYNTSATVPPQPGSFWRINFSRVEWAVKVVDGKYQKYPSCQSCPVPGTVAEDNWVWSPQGSIAMHLPERWGMLQWATGEVNGTAPIYNPEWPLRAVAASVYYAEHAYAAAHNGSFTADAGALVAYADPTYGGYSLNGTCTHGPPQITLTNASGTPGFIAWTVAIDGASASSITDDRYMRVFHGEEAVVAGPTAEALSPSRRGTAQAEAYLSTLATVASEAQAQRDAQLRATVSGPIVAALE